MKIALAQIDSTLGAFEKNKNKILDLAHKGKNLGAQIIVFPEACLFGYDPKDLIEFPHVLTRQLHQLEKLHSEMPSEVVLLVGVYSLNPLKKGRAFYNSIAFLEKEKPIQFFHKELLASYDVFDESRYLEPGKLSNNVLEYKGHKILLTICEDIWASEPCTVHKRNIYLENPLDKLLENNFDLVINISASPFTYEKVALRKQVGANVAKQMNCPLVYVNMVGAQDELIFDGGSFALNSDGNTLLQLNSFSEDLKVFNSEDQPPKLEKRSDQSQTNILQQKMETLERALTLGIKSFVNKIGLTRIHLGLSGGLDSAVVASLAVKALGAENVQCIALPGPFNSPMSLSLARSLAENLKVSFQSISINDAYNTLCSATGSSTDPISVVHENLQARIRGVLLMAESNHSHSLLLNTSNKSELAVGYSTLYGDLCGGLCPIGDIYKTEVFSLATYMNQKKELIPQGIIDRPPSAELRPDQKDEDSLPPYSVLDQILFQLIEEASQPETPLENEIFEKIKASEFKRWQAPPILKVSRRSFGQGRRFPIANSIASNRELQV